MRTKAARSIGQGQEDRELRIVDEDHSNRNSTSNDKVKVKVKDTDKDEEMDIDKDNDQPRDWKIQRILDILDFYFPDPPIPLNHSNGFTFLVAVVLSAQTTDGKVNAVTKELFAHADNPQAMAALSPDFVESVIRPVGLAPRKARSVVALSQKLVDDFAGKLPASFEGLESLPGVGHKTASVIMSQLFGVAALAVDTHVHRLALRWGLTNDTKNPDKVQQDLYRHFPRSVWNKVRFLCRFSLTHSLTHSLSVTVSLSRSCTYCGAVASADDLLRPAVLRRQEPRERVVSDLLLGAPPRRRRVVCNRRLAGVSSAEASQGTRLLRRPCGGVD
jgi:endonuclease III